MKRIDLHIHTNCSDGELSPKEIIDEAYKNNVEVIAIADHDTLAAYSDEVLKYARSKNIEVIKAIEMSTKSDKVGVHVLGYNIDIYNEALNEKLELIRNARHNYLDRVAQKLRGLGYIINVDRLSEIETVTKAHIATDVLENSSNSKLLKKHFNSTPSKGHFIETVMNENCPAYVKKNSITPREAANLIRNAGGKVILAHPVAYKYEDNLSESDVLEIVEDMKADGIEANYIYVHCENDKKINEIEKWNRFAKDNNLITTIGSDFHYDDNIHPLIGLVNENISLDEDEINKILFDLVEKD